MNLNNKELQKKLELLAKKETNLKYDLAKKYIAYKDEIISFRTSAKDLTRTEAYNLAKKQYQSLLVRLNSEGNDSDKRANILEALTYLSNYISEYENAKTNHEAGLKQIEDDMYDEKGIIIKQSILNDIKNVEVLLNDVKNEIVENNNVITSSGVDEDISKYISKSNSLNKKLNNINKQYLTLKSLLTLNGLVINNEKDSMYAKADKNIKDYYKLIRLTYDMNKVELEHKPVIEEPKKEKPEKKDKNYDEIDKLIEETYKDFSYVRFLKIVDLVNAIEDENDKEKYFEKLDDLKKTAKKFFVEELKKDDIEELVNKDDYIIKLQNAYQYLSEEEVEKYEYRFSKLIDIHNDYNQEISKKKYEPEEKYTFSQKLVEFFASPINFIAGTKVAEKINKKRLLKNRDKQMEAKTAEKAEKYKEKGRIISKRIFDSDIVSGLRLFIARNKINDVKPKLYSSEELTSNENYKLANASYLLSSRLEKGLSRKIKNNNMGTTSRRIINILDQFVELIATGDYEVGYDMAMDYLESVKNCITEETYYTYSEQFKLINKYRYSNNDEIYEINSNNEDLYETENIREYTDSEEYEKFPYQTTHILRRK